MRAGTTRVEQVDFVGREVVPGQQREVGADQRREVHVHAHEIIGELVGELRAHVRARITSVGAEPLVAELAHHPHPDACGLAPPDAGRHRRGEDRTRERRHDHVERVGRVAAEALGVRERLDHLGEVPERPRPSVREHERDRRGTGAPLVDRVHGHAVDLAPHVREAVHRGFLGAPVVLVDPVGHQLAQVCTGHAECPIVGACIRLVGPHRGAQAIAQQRQSLVGDLDPERREGHITLTPYSSFHQRALATSSGSASSDGSWPRSSGVGPM